MADGCAFCAIVAGETDAHVVFEDDDSLAFLDNRPLFPGHSLLIPREHHEAIWDLPEPLVATVFANARLLSVAVRTAMGAEGVFVATNNIVSQSVPHFHVHVVPRRRKDGLRGFFWPRSKYGDDAEAIAARDGRRPTRSSITGWTTRGLTLYAPGREFNSPNRGRRPRRTSGKTGARRARHGLGGWGRVVRPPAALTSS